MVTHFLYMQFFFQFVPLGEFQWLLTFQIQCFWVRQNVQWVGSDVFKRRHSKDVDLARLYQHLDSILSSGWSDILGSQSHFGFIIFRKRRYRQLHCITIKLYGNKTTPTYHTMQVYAPFQIGPKDKKQHLRVVLANRVCSPLTRPSFARWRCLLNEMYDEMGSLHGCLAVKCDSCNNL